MSSVEEKQNNLETITVPDITIENPEMVKHFTGESILLGTMLGVEKLVRDAVSNGVPIDYSDEYGVQAIHIASHYGNLEILNVLIELHADVNATTNSGYTPLLISCEGGIGKDTLQKNYSNSKYLKPLQSK